MQNPPTSTRRVDAKSEILLVSIIPARSTQAQAKTKILKHSFEYAENPTTKEFPACHNKLILLAKQQRFTDCLDWLECNAGITGESAIFTLSWCVGGGSNA
jgi:hypothetical protein